MHREYNTAMRKLRRDASTYTKRMSTQPAALRWAGAADATRMRRFEIIESSLQQLYIDEVVIAHDCPARNQ